MFFYVIGEYFTPPPFLVFLNVRSVTKWYIVSKCKSVLVNLFREKSGRSSAKGGVVEQNIHYTCFTIKLVSFFHLYFLASFSIFSTSKTYEKFDRVTYYILVYSVDSCGER